MRVSADVRKCVYCGQGVYDYWNIGTQLGWVLAEGAQYAGDDHCEKAGDAAHHAVEANR